jgi:hypothetical protein
MNNNKNLFVTPNEKLLCIKGTEHLFSVCHKTSDFVTETVAENIEEKTAHLFAAAPDLLSALESLAVWNDGEPCFCHVHGESERARYTPHDSYCDKARETLLKAKGAK